MRLLASVCLLASVLACAPSPPEETPPSLSPGASRLLIQEDQLGVEAQRLLVNLRADPYVYFRFINRPWARAVCEALSPELAEMPQVRLHGDAHVSQYAFTRTDHGLDDLDDTIDGPAALDIVRFLGSIDLATRARGWTAERDALFDQFLRGYRAGAKSPDDRPSVPSYVVRMREGLPAEELGQAEFLRWAESLMQPIDAADEGGIEEGRRRLAELIAELRPDLPTFYLELKRAGWLRMGVGSALTPKLLLRTEGTSRAPEDDVLLEARELSDLSGVPCVDADTPVGAIRILEGYGRMGRIRHDIVVVVPSAPDATPAVREWWARSWEPSYRELRLDELESPGELGEVVRDAGFQLGAGHSRAPEDRAPGPPPNPQLDWLDRSEGRMRWVATQMTEDLLEAWEAFRTQ
jgi:hypothetical protein